MELKLRLTIRQDPLRKRDKESLLFLGRACEEGLGVERNLTAARIFFLRAGTPDEKEAPRSRIPLSEEAGSTITDPDLRAESDPGNRESVCVELSIRSAPLAEKDEQAQLRIARACEKGYGVEKNLLAAWTLYRNSRKSGGEEGALGLARLLVAGEGSEGADPDRAVEICLKLAVRGSAKAMTQLGLFNEYGIPEGEPDYDNSFDWYTWAAEEKDVDGFFHQAVSLFSGMGVEEDRGTALEAFRYLAERENYPRAWFYLGLYAQEGYLEDPDYPEALACYRKGAKDGDIESCNQLGVLYGKGLGVKKSLPESWRWYIKAAARGDSLAYTNIAWFLETGTGCPKADPEEAIRWYETAAKDEEEYALEALDRLNIPRSRLEDRPETFYCPVRNALVGPDECAQIRLRQSKKREASGKIAGCLDCCHG